MAETGEPQARMASYTGWNWGGLTAARDHVSVKKMECDPGRHHMSTLGFHTHAHTFGHEYRYTCTFTIHVHTCNTVVIIDLRAYSLYSHS